jgi:hypothetical protein
MMVTITLYDEKDNPALIIDSTDDQSKIRVHVCDEVNGVDIDIDELKTALRKLSAK